MEVALLLVKPGKVWTTEEMLSRWNIKLTLPSDDIFCHRLANDNTFCVVSMEYRKGPRYRFPTAIEDLVEETHAVLEDSSIPGDRAKVALGGFSAGGNLTLAVSQIDSVRARIRGILCLYPVVDWMIDLQGRMAEKEYDILKGTEILSYIGYLPLDQDAADPLISPINAPRQTLPQKIMFVGAEDDSICPEAELMAEQLADVEGDRFGPSGKSGLKSWNHGDVAWRKIIGMGHGFTHLPSSDPGAETARREAVEYTYSEVGRWLRREVFA